MKRQPICWTPDKYLQLWWLSKVATIQETATIMECSYNTIKQTAHRLRCMIKQPIIFRRPDYTKWSKKEEIILWKYSDEHSLKFIANKLGRSYLGVKQQSRVKGIRGRVRALTFTKLAKELGIGKATLIRMSQRLQQEVLIISGFARLTDKQADQLRQCVKFALKYSKQRNKFSQNRKRKCHGSVPMQRQTKPTEQQNQKLACQKRIHNGLGEHR